MNDYLEFLALYGVGGAHPGGLALTKKILEEELISENTAILDAGCGTGQTAAFLKNFYNCQVDAIDIHPLMVKKAEDRFETLGLDIYVKESSTENMDVEDHSYEMVLYESVINFTNKKNTLFETIRVLKKPGIMIAIEMTNEGLLTAREKQVLQQFYGVTDILTEEEWIQTFINAGFKKASSKSAATVLEEITSKNEPGIEFQLSPSILEKYHKVFDQHEILTQQFQKKLGYRVYRCEV